MTSYSFGDTDIKVSKGQVEKNDRFRMNLDRQT